MPDPTKGSPLAGIEQNVTEASQWFARHAATNASRIATHHAGTLAHAADYLAGLGKVLEEWREAEQTGRALADSLPDNPTKAERQRRAKEVEAALSRAGVATDALYTYLTSPRETVGKENER